MGPSWLLSGRAGKRIARVIPHVTPEPGTGDHALV